MINKQVLAIIIINILCPHLVMANDLSNQDTQKPVESTAKMPETAKNLEEKSNSKHLKSEHLNSEQKTTDQKGTQKQATKNDSEVPKTNQDNADAKKKAGLAKLYDWLPIYQSRKKKQDTTKKITQDHQKKAGFFKRLYQRYFGDDEVGEVERITVTVNKVPKALATNVTKALSQVSVDEFNDFKDVLPRLRALAKDAAKAVGYYDATFVLDKIDATRMKVTITANQPVRIASVDFKILGNAKHTKAFYKLLLSPFKKGNVFNHRKYTQTKLLLQQKAQTLGFFDAAWVQSYVEVLRPDNVANITMVFDSGPRYHFGKVYFVDKMGKPYQESDIKKQIEVNENLLTKLKTFQTNEPFDQNKLNEFINGLLTTQYFNSVDVEVLKPQDEDASQISFENTFNETNEIENAHIDGILVTDAIFNQPKPIIIKNQKQAKQTSEASQTQNQTQKTQIPSKQAITVANNAKRVPIRIILDSSRPNSAEIGLGYGTDTGFRVRGKVARNLLNQRGHQVRLNVEASKKKQAVELSYQKPFRDPLNDTITYLLGYERELRDSGLNNNDITINEITAGLQRNVNYGKWHRTYTLTYYLDQLKTTVPEDKLQDLPPPFNLSNASFAQQILLLGYRLNTTQIKGGLQAFEGYKLYSQIEVASNNVLSDVTLGILRAGASGLYTFGDTRKQQVVGRLDLATIATDNFTKVPYNHRFFTGGDRSIRGYDYKSLSPLNSKGYLVGGQHLVTGSAEYIYYFKDNWGIATFIDAGNAYDNPFSNPTKIGTGIGLRWRSPIGPVRIDVAAGVSEQDPPIRFHFYIGPPL